MKALLIACVGLAGIAAYAVHDRQSGETVRVVRSIERSPHATFTAMSRQLRPLNQRQATYSFGRRLLTFAYQEKPDEEILVSVLVGGETAMVHAFRIEPEAGGSRTRLSLDLTVHPSPLTKGKSRLKEREQAGLEGKMDSIADAIARDRSFDLFGAAIQMKPGPLTNEDRTALAGLVREGEISEEDLAKLERKFSQ